MNTSGIKDISDVHKTRGPNAVLKLLRENLEEVKIARAESEVSNSRGSKRQPLTIRSISEILEMSFDNSDLILPNGYLAFGERTAICGMGGVGKSRLTMQLALCCRTGRSFLGWETQGRDLRWLFLQTENSCRRLQFDLERMLTAFTPEECEAIKEGVFFHTLEGDEDGFLMLDLANSERIMEAIASIGAAIVVFDPLRDFGSDDLNSDKHMTETLREISRVTKRGNPRRIPLVIHHAGTGRAGIQKTTGFDRSSFGRNSKVLFSWARAQINVAPALADSNDMIIVASAKCSNAREFEPFAVRLNEDTMLYDRDEDFDLNEWRLSLEPSRGADNKPTTEILLDLLPLNGSIPKAAVIERLRDKGISERKSRAFISAVLAPNGPVHEWHIKRSGRRDEIHLSREAQPPVES